MNRREVMKALPALTVAGSSAANAFAGDTARGPSSQQSRYLLAITQLGFRQASVKSLTLVPQDDPSHYAEKIPFYIIPEGYVLPRQSAFPEAWKKSVYGWPFDLGSSPWAGTAKSRADAAVFNGELIRSSKDRWGACWQADFSSFTKPGIYQIETEKQFTLPFQIGDAIYERVVRGYLVYLYSQRAGFAVPGIRPAENVDDAVLDTDGTYVPASGGWFDAGDTRKNMALTAFHLEALHAIYQHSEVFRTQVLDEIAWGNRWIHAMMAPDGSIWEDIGGGAQRGGKSYEEGWWTENHPGCIADNSGNRITDNIVLSGDERPIRTNYNPWVQFGFVRLQAMISTILPATDAAQCKALSEKAWRTGVRRGHDRRTLFVSAQLRAGLELMHANTSMVKSADVAALANELLSRQDTGTEGLSHYFLEKDAKDGFRSVAFSCDPPLSLLRLCELRIEGTEGVLPTAENAVRQYIERYLLADSSSNAYGVTPYGVFVRMPWPEAQTYRPAGRGRGVRTFIHPFNDQFMVHGTNGVLMHQAHLLARAGKYFKESRYQAHAEKLLQWSMGHNPTALSTFTGIGYKHPIAFSTQNLKIPEAVVNGFAGRPDDSPYLETANLVQWNTQEIWGIPYIHAIGAVVHL